MLGRTRFAGALASAAALFAFAALGGAAPAAASIAACPEGSSELWLNYDDTADCAFHVRTDLDSFGFHGTPGTRARVIVKGVSGVSASPVVEIRGPMGGLLWSGACNPECDLEPDENGTYHLAVQEAGLDNTGSYEVTLACLFGACDSNGDGTPDPAPEPVRHATLWKEFERRTDVDVYEFLGVGDTEMRLIVKGVSGVSTSPSVEIWDPDGVQLHDGICNPGCEARAFSESPSPTLPKTGTYRLVVSEAGLDNTGTYQVTLACLFGDCDLDADGVADPQDNCLEVANPSQIDADLDGIGNHCDADFDNNGTVGGPDFLTFGAAFGCELGDACFVPAVDLNGDGLIGGPDYLLFGRAFGRPPGPSRLARIGYGQTVDASFDAITDVDTLVFEGTAGTDIRVTAKGISGVSASPTVEIRDPDGEVLHAGACNPGCDRGLVQTGTYRLTLSEAGLDNTGTYEVTLSCLFGPCDSDADGTPDPAPPQIGYGETISASFERRTDVDSLEFDGTAGSLVRLIVLGTSGVSASPRVEIRDPDGVVIHDGPCNPGCDLLLPKTGRYRVTISEAGQDNVGTYETTLACLFGACG
jgi:hypothetical protein